MLAAQECSRTNQVILIIAIAIERHFHVQPSKDCTCRMDTDAANRMPALNASPVLPLANKTTKIEATRINVIDSDDISHDPWLPEKHLWDPPHACDMSPAPFFGALEGATVGRT
jgi:hypothetical protein